MVELSVVASKKLLLTDRRVTSLDRRFGRNIGESISPSEANCARLSRNLARLRPRPPDCRGVLVDVPVGVSPI